MLLRWIKNLLWFTAGMALIFVLCMLVPQRGFAACGFDAGSLIGGMPPEIADVLKDKTADKPKLKCDPLGEKPKADAKQKSQNKISLFVGDLVALEGEFVPDEVIATISGDIEFANQIAADFNLTVRSATPLPVLGGLLVRFGIPDKRSVTFVRSLIANSEGVIAATANHIYRLNDSLNKSKKKIPRYALKAAQIDGVAERGRGIKIVMIDSDIDSQHPSLKNAVAGRFDALDGAPRRSLTHGTGIALLIAGGEPFQGAAPEAELYVARAFDSDEKGGSLNSAFAILRSLDWAFSQGVDIINMSFAGPENKLISEALLKLSQQNIILVAAAGNHGPRAPFAFPAASEHVFAVTAIDAKNRVYSKANQGSYVFVSAPGVDVMLTSPADKIIIESGTSFGAALFSGIAALVLEKFGQIDIKKFGRIIEESAKDLGAPGRDKVYGVGLVQVRRMLQ